MPMHLNSTHICRIAMCICACVRVCVRVCARVGTIDRAEHICIEFYALDRD